ncbi:short-chain dehydrogenase/reductas [Mycobacterium saskatchewanense]|uniref:Short-chain dehydrogenase n=1 Tax=Mycobacterium saskatchewanense TaxID=220927 RepID=A0AAJ3NMF1_9MYCO|nr:SDR family oxidoreductase [Mycobacterium saskatchewanense]ORW67706.1 short-chain dehydrogenase [Mycobacterium saskatchewanense]BBX64404.1 short-chain dehydrogenase/reductas [Mycobacterium saskatchewanense]
MAREVLTVLGVGGMGQAIAHRLGPGKTVLLADKDEAALTAVAGALTSAGYHVESRAVDVSSPDSVRALAHHAASLGAVTQVVHTAGLSPAQASAAAILAVDLLGTALVLEEFGQVVAPGGAGVVVASMAGHMFPALSAEQERVLAHTPGRDLLGLDFVSPHKITEPGIAYGIAKQANHVRVRAASAQWGARGARVNSISPGVISTPMGQQELASPVGDGMRAMIAASATGRLGTPGDIAAATAFLLGPEASFITGTDLLVDGGVIAAIKAGSPAV